MVMILTYSLVVAEVGLGFGVRLQFLLLVAHIHPSIFHDLLEGDLFIEFG